jgi:hypothetical protein
VAKQQTAVATVIFISLIRTAAASVGNSAVILSFDKHYL